MCQAELRASSNAVSFNSSGNGVVWRQVRRCKRLITRRRSSSTSSTCCGTEDCVRRRDWMLVERSRYVLSNGLAYSNTASRYILTFLPVTLFYWGLCEARKRGGGAAKRSYLSIKNYVAVSDTQPFDAVSSTSSDDDDCSRQQKSEKKPLKRRQRFMNKLRLYSRYDQQPAARSPWNVPLFLIFYQFLPLRALSRAWGWVNDIYLPWMLRVPILGLYVWSCGCNLREAECSDLTKYRNLGMFFRRRLRAGIRPINKQAALVSPADGQVIHFGRVESDQIEQVKGLTYSLAAFLGPQTWDKKKSPNNDEKTAGKSYRHELCQYRCPVEQPNKRGDDSGTDCADDKNYVDAVGTERKDNNKEKDAQGPTSLFHCIIYLSPGDYHRFHSPTEWQVFYRRHFPGTLFSVSPRVCRYIEGLFNFNERVAYIGKWAYGFFATVAVGATNVGTIKVHFDELLRTNVYNKKLRCAGLYEDVDFRVVNEVEADAITTHSTSQAQDPCVRGNEEFAFPVDKENHIVLERGNEWGEFRLGSTIVMLFEAPRSFAFCLDVNQKIKLGEPIGFVGGAGAADAAGKIQSD